MLNHVYASGALFVPPPWSYLDHGEIRFAVFVFAVIAGVIMWRVIGSDAKHYNAAKKKFAGRIEFVGNLSETDKKAQRVEERSLRLEEKAQECLALSDKYASKADVIAGDTGKMLEEIKRLEGIAGYLAANANLAKEIEWLQRTPSIPNINDIATAMAGITQRQKMEAEIMKQACAEINASSYHQPKSEAWLLNMSGLLQQASRWMSLESEHLRNLNVAAIPAYGVRTR